MSHLMILLVYISAFVKFIRTLKLTSFIHMSVHTCILDFLENRSLLFVRKFAEKNVPSAFLKNTYLTKHF